MRRSAFVGSVVLALVLTAMAAGAQPQSTEEQLRSLRGEVDALKDAHNRLQKDVQEIKTLLQRLGRAQRPEEPALQDIVLGATDGQGKGADSARLVLVDFTDYQ